MRRDTTQQYEGRRVIQSREDENNQIIEDIVCHVCLFGSGYHKNIHIPEIVWLKQQKRCLTVLEPGKSKLQVPAYSVLGERSLPGL